MPRGVAGPLRYMYFTIKPQLKCAIYRQFSNLADVGGLGDQVAKALKLEGLLCTERLVVRATSAP